MPPRALFAFLLLSLAWGSSYLGTNIAVRELGPFSMVLWRLGLGVAVLCAAAVVSRPAWPRSWRAYGAVAAYSVIGIALPLWLVSWSLRHTDSSLAAILVTTAPIFTMLIAHVALGDDRMTLGRVGGVLLGFGGVALLLSRELAAGVNSTALASVTLLAVALCYASASVFARRYTGGTPPLVNALVAQGSAALILAVLTPLAEGGYTLPQSGQVWLAVLWVGVFSSGVAFVCYYYLLHSIGPTRLQMVNFLILVIAMALGVLLNDEPLSWNRMGGSLLILSALVVANRKSVTSKVAPPPLQAAATGPLPSATQGD